MSTTSDFEGLQRRVEALERRLEEIEETEATPVLKISELHIVDTEGESVITLSVNENGAGEIRVGSLHGMSGVSICGEDENGGGFLEVFKEFTEILNPCILQRKDAVRLGIQQEDLGGGGQICTFKNYADSVRLGSLYGYGGFVSVSGEYDAAHPGAGRILLGINRKTDEGVILLRTPGDADAENDNMKTLTKLGNGEPPAYRAHEDGKNQEKGESP